MGVGVIPGGDVGLLMWKLADALSVGGRPAIPLLTLALSMYAPGCVLAGTVKVLVNAPLLSDVTDARVMLFPPFTDCQRSCTGDPAGK